MEEGGFVREGEGSEDQLYHSDVGSSCASGGQAVARVALEGLDDADTDSDASGGGQRIGALRDQVCSKSMGNKGIVGECGGKSSKGAEDTSVIPSNEPLLKGTDEHFLIKSPTQVRGSNSLVNVEREEHRAVGPVMCSNPVTCSPNPMVQVEQVGPQLGQVDLTESVQEVQVNGSATIPGLGLNPNAGSGKKKQGVNYSNRMAIDGLENLIQQSRGKAGGGGKNSELSEDNQSVSSSNFQRRSDVVQSFVEKSKGTKQRKVPIPLSPLLGPKCLRFAGMVNNNNCLAKRRSNSVVFESVSSESRSEAPIVQEDRNGSEDIMQDQENEVLQVCPLVSQVNVVEQPEPQYSPGLVLEVVLPFQQAPQVQSGVNLLLREESLQDVNGFLASRDNPESKILEAKKLMCEQQELGFSFDHNLEEPIGRMVGMEGRDRSEFLKRQESSRPQ
ncbi:hypothetical protein QL285_071706 [Trifolium repens]|nr:hypothetical protein QL285_071706 [Trifolium repens]